MIGDRSYDLVAAHENQLQACAVTWGFGDAQELQKERPEFTVDSAAELTCLSIRSGASNVAGEPKTAP